MSTCPLDCGVKWQENKFNHICNACMFEFGQRLDDEQAEEDMPGMIVSWKNKLARHKAYEASFEATLAKLKATQTELEATQAKLQATQAELEATQAKLTYTQARYKRPFEIRDYN